MSPLLTYERLATLHATAGAHVRSARDLVAELRQRSDLRRRFPETRIDTGVTIVNPDRLMLGPCVQLHHGVHLHCGGFPWSGGAGHIRIGAHSVVAAYNVWFGAGGVEVGERLDAGPGVMIFSSQSDSRPPPPGGSRGHELGRVVIGDDVLIYAGCVVRPGVTIGDGAVLAAGAVIVRDVPPRTLWGGVPARRIRDLA